jgi:uncharacterized membrane protein YfcA
MWFISIDLAINPFQSRTITTNEPLVGIIFHPYIKSQDTPRLDGLFIMPATLTPVEIASIFGITLISAGLQGTVGYGMGLIASPFLILIDSRFIPGPFLFGMLIFATLMAFRERKSIDVSGLKWVVTGRIPGSIIGAAVLSTLPRENYIIIFGLLIILASLMGFAGFSIPANKPYIFIAGVVSGIMGTLASIGGPPVALIFQKESGPRLRAMLSSFFLIGMLISIASLAAYGQFGVTEVKLGMLLLPGTLLGLYSSSRFAIRLDRGYTRNAVLLLSMISGLFVVFQQILK